MSVLQGKNRIRMEFYVALYYSHEIYIGGHGSKVLHIPKGSTRKTKNIISNIECSVHCYIKLDVRFQHILESGVQ